MARIAWPGSSNLLQLPISKAYFDVLGTCGAPQCLSLFLWCGKGWKHMHHFLWRHAALKWLESHTMSQPFVDSSSEIKFSAEVLAQSDCFILSIVYRFSLSVKCKIHLAAEKDYQSESRRRVRRFVLLEFHLMSGVQFRHRQIVFRKMHVRIARIRFLVCWSPFCLMRQVCFFQVFSQCFQFSWFRVLFEYLNVNRIDYDLLAVKMQQKYTYVWNPFDIYSMRFIHDIHSLTIHASRYQPVDLQAEEEAGWSCWKLWGLWRCRNVRTPKCSKRHAETAPSRNI